MTFKDLIDGFTATDVTTSLRPMNVLIVLAITFGLSMIIFFTYKINSDTILYNHTFNVSIVIMALITAGVIITIRSNLVLSLGMVGALSIVRFRTAIKNPMDIVYLFWSIGLGITTGAGLFIPAVIICLFVAGIIFLLMKMPNSVDVFLLVIQYDENVEEEVLDDLSSLAFKLKSKRAFGDMIELTGEIRRTDKGTSFVQEINSIKGVKNVSFVSYNGEFQQ